MALSPQKKPLTDLQALVRARQRWGPRGAAWHPAGECKGGESYSLVGVTDGTNMPHRWTIYGIGKTFEEAFIDAETRGN